MNIVGLDYNSEKKLPNIPELERQKDIVVYFYVQEENVSYYIDSSLNKLIPEKYRR